MRFEAELFQAGKTATGIEIPAAIIKKLNSGKRPKLQVKLKKHTFQTTVGVMGGRYLIPVSAENRKLAGVEAGETLVIDISLDNNERAYEVPDDLAKALNKSKLRKQFDALAPSHRKEHIRSVEEAKKPETRLKRVESVVAKLSQ